MGSLDEEMVYFYVFFDGSWRLLQGSFKGFADGLEITEETLNLPLFKNKLFHLPEPDGFDITDLFCLKYRGAVVTNIFAKSAQEVLESLPYQYLEDLPEDFDFDAYLIQIKQRMQPIQEGCSAFMQKYGLR